MNKELTGAEYLYCYCQLTLHGYTHQEAQDIIEEIKSKLKHEEEDE